MASAPQGRPSTYTPEMGDRICAAIIATKQGLRKALESDPELPAMGTVMGWLANNLSFQSVYAQAKELQLKAMAEDIIDISDDDTLDPGDKRIMVDSRKWILSKLMPRTYGDKLDVTSGGEALSAPSHQIDARVQSIIMQAQQRRLKAADAGTLTDEALKLLD